MSSRETNILISLLIVLSSLVGYRIATREEPKRVRELTFKPVVSSGRPLAVGNQEPETSEIKTEALKMEKRPYRGVIRNPFQPLYPPAPPPPVIIPKQIPLPPVPAPFPVITARGPSPAQLESKKIRFLGFLQKEGDRKIFLSRDKEVVIVKKGDDIGIFQIAEILDTSVTIISRDTKEEFRLIIEDVKPTKPDALPGALRR